jgi:hypothetical protein
MPATISSFLRKPERYDRIEASSVVSLRHIGRPRSSNLRRTDVREYMSLKITWTPGVLLMKGKPLRRTASVPPP